MLNLSGIQNDFKKPNNMVDRATLAVGDSVGFINRDTNKELYGKVIKLNPKTASIRVMQGERSQQWRVSYGCLFYVVDTTQGFLEIT